ncbi:MAG TPA: iron ABC transporter permease [Alphaproteobacteria bacterium]|nr:iron ABC transporter permease [Alphaproteobacteria bacterium]
MTTDMSQAPAAFQRRRAFSTPSWCAPWPIAAGLIAILVATPLLVVVSSLATPSFDIWAHLWRTYLLELVWNTLALIVGVGVGVLVLGIGLAWLVSMHRFPGCRLFEWLLILPMAIPAYVIGFVFLALFDFTGPVQTWWRGLFGPKAWFPDIASYGGVVLVMTLVLYPYVYLLTRTALLEQSAGVLEAARALGTRPCGLFWRVLLPLARPAIVAGLALALMEALADFGTVSIYSYSTFTVAIYRVWFGLFDRDAATELASLLLFFTLGLFILERVMRGRARFSQTEGSVRPVTPKRLSGWRAWAAAGACSLVVGVAFILPVGQLLVWMAKTLGGPEYDARYPTFLLNTLTLAAVTALLAVGTALIMAYGLRLSRSRLVVLGVRLASMGYALPGSVIAVGVLVPLAALDRALGDILHRTLGISAGLLLTGSMVGLVFAYLVRFLAISIQTVEASLIKITPNMDMAARSLGTGSAGVLWRIHLPLLKGSLGCAAILVFVDVMKEMPATLLLRPFGYDTLAVRIWQLTSESFWEVAALPALTIVVGGILPVLVLIRRVRPLTHTSARMAEDMCQTPGSQ